MTGSHANGYATKSRPSLRSENSLKRQNEKPSETLAERFRGLAVSIQFHLDMCRLLRTKQHL